MALGNDASGDRGIPRSERSRKREPPPRPIRGQTRSLWSAFRASVDAPGFPEHDATIVGGRGLGRRANANLSQ